MTTDVIDAPPTDPAPPAVRPMRVLRAVLVVVTAAALLVAVATLVDWAWGPGRSTDAWSSRFGDPRITLAKGTTLPSSPETLTRWTLEPTTYGLPEDTSVLEAAFGGPVVPVDEHTWATASGTVEFTMLDEVLAHPTSWMNRGPEFFGAAVEQVADAPTFTTEAAQTAEVRRILAVLGWPANASLRVSGTGTERTTWTDADGTQHVRQLSLGRSIRVLPPVPDAETKPGSSVFPAPWFMFGPDGTLKHLSLAPWALVQPAGTAQVRSAQEALDDLRHHRREVTFLSDVKVPNLVERVLGSNFFPDDSDSTPAGPITDASLYGDCTGLIGRTHPCWVFNDADGNFVGSVLAARDDVYPATLR